MKRKIELYQVALSLSLVGPMAILACGRGSTTTVISPPDSLPVSSTIDDPSVGLASSLGDLPQILNFSCLSPGTVECEVVTWGPSIDMILEYRNASTDVTLLERKLTWLSEEDQPFTVYTIPLPESNTVENTHVYQMQHTCQSEQCSAVQLQTEHRLINRPGLISDYSNPVVTVSDAYPPPNEGATQPLEGLLPLIQDLSPLASESLWTIPVNSKEDIVGVDAEEFWQERSFTDPNADPPIASAIGLIQFSEYPVGTSITTQYSNRGIVFGGSAPYIMSDGANAKSPVLTGSPMFRGPIEGQFVNPSNGFPALVEGFSLRAGYLNQIGAIRLTWFDGAGEILGQQANTTTGFRTFTVHDENGIARWRIENIGVEPAGFAIDDVSVGAVISSIPSPSPTPSPSPSLVPSPSPFPSPSPIACESPAQLISRMAQGFREEQLTALANSEDCDFTPEDREIVVNKSTVSINFDDWLETDGDIIHVSLVETNYNQVLTLPFSAATLEIPLKVGRNRLRIRAVNTGTSGPNTMGMYFRPTSQVISGLTSTQMGLQQNQEIEFVLILEDENEDYETKYPPRLIVRDYNLSMKVTDNGELIDGDEITIALGADVGPNQGNIQDEDILLDRGDRLVGIRELRSHLNSLLIEAKSEGDVEPATLGFVIDGVEIDPSAPGDTTSSRLGKYEGSIPLSGSELIDITIECRRQAARSRIRPAAILARNLETAANPGVATLSPPLNWNDGYYGQRLPCDTAAHHIVAEGLNSFFPQVRSSQKILSAFGIGINDAVNGVVLPDNRKNPNVPVTGYPHWGGGVHSGTTHTRINARLAASVRVVDPELFLDDAPFPEIDQNRLNYLKNNDPAQVVLIKLEIIHELADIRNIFVTGHSNKHS